MQSVFGILGGMGADVDDVIHQRRTAERLFGDDFEWSVLGAGAAQIRVAALSLALGDNARVGLEDSLWDGPGHLAEANRDQVERVRMLAEAVHRSIASPTEARERLRLRGVA